MKNLSLLLLVGLLLLVVGSACARLQKPINAEERRDVIEMTASDFTFEPNNITARPGETITFRIRDTSGTAHNFTIKDTNGSTMQSIDIPPKGSVDVKITFPKAGTYKFYCDKTGHSELGMKGQVVAAAG